ncbi:hypothetical protein SAMN05414139_01376 [Burkholderia sp. D7]|nr:hypothetical protein SAMN05414139_01376 [Burkholderia sp. D7]
MADSLASCRVVILAVDGFEQARLVAPRKALKAAGTQVHGISQKPGQIQGFVHTDKRDMVMVDVHARPIIKHHYAMAQQLARLQGVTS